MKKLAAKKNKLYAPAVLITGASSGIGLAFAKYYAKQKKTLLLVSANTKRLQAAKSQLKSLTQPDQIFLCPTNLVDVDAVEKVFQFAEKTRLAITSLINNAGIGFLGKTTQMSEAKIEEICRLNVLTLTKFSRRFLLQLQKYPLQEFKQPLQLINVASIAAFIPSPYFAVYSATKSYVNSFTMALTREIEDFPYPVKILSLCPGVTNTNFFNRAKSSTPEKISSTLFQTSSPEFVVQEAMHALSKNQPVRICGKINQLKTIIAQVLPKKWVTWNAKRIFRLLIEK